MFYIDGKILTQVRSPRLPPRSQGRKNRQVVDTDSLETINSLGDPAKFLDKIPANCSEMRM